MYIVDENIIWKKFNIVKINLQIPFVRISVSRIFFVKQGFDECRVHDFFPPLNHCAMRFARGQDSWYIEKGIATYTTRTWYAKVIAGRSLSRIRVGVRRRVSLCSARWGTTLGNPAGNKHYNCNAVPTLPICFFGLILELCSRAWSREAINNATKAIRNCCKINASSSEKNANISHGFISDLQDKYHRFFNCTQAMF